MRKIYGLVVYVGLVVIARLSNKSVLNVTDDIIKDRNKKT